MLTIQNLLKNVYCCIRNISKKCYRDCAVIVSGCMIVALISLNAQAFGGTGKNKVTWAEGSALKETEEGSTEEELEEMKLAAGPDFVTICKNAIKEDHNCANLETTEHIQMELPQEPVNPYQAVTLSQEDYEVLCRIVQAEAGEEEEKGRILVAEVILNRVLSEHFPNSVSEVVFQKAGGSAQFSPTIDGRFYTVTVSDATKESVEKALNGEDFSEGALFFSARSKADPNNMAWFDSNLKWLFQCGGHEFYTLP